MKFHIQLPKDSLYVKQRRGKSNTFVIVVITRRFEIYVSRCGTAQQRRSFSKHACTMTRAILAQVIQKHACAFSLRSTF